MPVLIFVMHFINWMDTALGISAASLLPFKNDTWLFTVFFSPFFQILLFNYYVGYIPTGILKQLLYYHISLRIVCLFLFYKFCPCKLYLVTPISKCLSAKPGFLLLLTNTLLLCWTCRTMVEQRPFQQLYSTHCISLELLASCIFPSILHSIYFF